LPCVTTQGYVTRPSGAAVDVFVEVVDGGVEALGMPGVEVADGDDALEAAVFVANGEVADAPFLHRGGDFVEIGVDAAVGDGGSHDVFDGGGGGVAGLGDDAGEDVAFGEDADDVLGLSVGFEATGGDDQRSDVMAVHSAGGLKNRYGGIDDMNGGALTQEDVHYLSHGEVPNGGGDEADARRSGVECRDGAQRGGSLK
jgi:hypothetical protein